jgi:hypothetical protein
MPCIPTPEGCSPDVGWVGRYIPVAIQEADK